MNYEISTKEKRHVLFVFLCVFCLFFAVFHTSQVHGASKAVKYNGKTIARYNSSRQMVLIPSKNASTNYWNLMHLISGNKKKTVVIPKGSKISLSGTLHPGNNTTIIAKGATVIGKKESNIIFGAPNKKLKNLSVIGGKWRSPDKGGRTGSLFAFSYVNGLVMDGINCNANYRGHAIEIIACKNVTIKNSKVFAIGSNPKTCQEEQIQIDLATKKTAPKIAEFGKKYVQGQTCRNVSIINNTVTGARAVGVNWSNSENNKWRSKFHKNIVIQGNTLTGTTAEALSYFNVIGGKIVDNTIKTKAVRADQGDSHTIGIHAALCGKAPKEMAGSSLLISGNRVWGNRNGIHIMGYFDKSKKECISRFGKVQVLNNKVYCRQGAEQGIVQVKQSCRIFEESGNQAAVWK